MAHTLAALAYVTVGSHTAMRNGDVTDRSRDEVTLHLKAFNPSTGFPGWECCDAC
jgi:hypothetical protein